MDNNKSQVDIEDEVVAVRVLSVVFIVFMVLIVGSYSDIPKDEITQNTTTHSTVSAVHSTNLDISPSNSTVNIKTGLKTEIQSLITYK